MSKVFKNALMPVNRPWGFRAVALLLGSPSQIMTLSARYVAMMKSCSTMNAVFLLCMMKHLITGTSQQKAMSGRQCKELSLQIFDERWSVNTRTGPQCHQSGRFTLPDDPGSGQSYLVSHQIVQPRFTSP